MRSRAITTSEGAARARRARILRAMVEVVAERGYAGASVGLVVTRARVSRRTFEGLFTGLEDCFRAVLDLGLERTVGLVGEAFEGQDTWRDGVRVALASLLVFLDREPLLARVWLVESLGAGAWALEHRERNLRAVRELVLSGWPVAREWGSPPLAAEGAVASVLGIVHSHIVTNRPGPLIELLGPLMGLVAGPYLSPRSIAREVERGHMLAREIQAGRYSLGVEGEQPERLPPMPVGAPAMLENPNAYRARECLLFVVENPGVSNREIAAGIRVAHKGQLSTLLGRLAKLGLLSRHAQGAGHRTLWRATAQGQHEAQVLRQSPRNTRQEDAA